MARVTMVQERERVREEARQHILKIVKPGDTLYTVLNHVSKSGMYRCISVYAIVDGEPYWLNGWAATVLGWGRDEKHNDGIKCGGCGMDMGFHLVYSLSRYLWPGGWDCDGSEKCLSNDHVNARRGTFPICGDRVDSNTHTRKSHGYDYPTCEDHATCGWHHNDGGYALKQRWM